MDDEKDVVNQEESASSAPVQEESVETQTQAPETTTQDAKALDVEERDERGVPWKNVAMEAQRKLQEMPQVIKQTVEETLKNNQAQNQPQQYTKDHIPMLRQYAADNPNYTSWVEQQIEDIRAREQAKVIRQEMEGFKREQSDHLTRQQSEGWVLNHPVFKDCFSDVMGQKQWNMSNPLTQIISQYLNTSDPVTGKRIADRPDGLMVAAKMAYGDFALSSMVPKATTQVTQLKKDLRKAQKSTMVPATGSPSVSNPKSASSKHLDTYNKSYNKTDIRAATKARLFEMGVLKEE